MTDERRAAKLRAANRARMIAEQSQNGKARVTSWGGKPTAKADRRNSKLSLKGAA